MIETEKRVREAVRYLGFGRNEADERTLELIQQSFKDLEQEAGPKSICQIFDLNHTELTYDKSFIRSMVYKASHDVKNRDEYLTSDVYIYNRELKELRTLKGDQSWKLQLI